MTYLLFLMSCFPCQLPVLNTDIIKMTSILVSSKSVQQQKVRYKRGRFALLVFAQLVFRGSTAKKKSEYKVEVWSAGSRRQELTPERYSSSMSLPVIFKKMCFFWLCKAKYVFCVRNTRLLYLLLSAIIKLFNNFFYDGIWRRGLARSYSWWQWHLDFK